MTAGRNISAEAEAWRALGPNKHEEAIQEVDIAFGQLGKSWQRTGAIVVALLRAAAETEAKTCEECHGEGTVTHWCGEAPMCGSDVPCPVCKGGAP